MSANTIIIAGDYRKLQSKVIATGQTIKPGMLLKENSDGKLEVHGTAGDYAERIVALEDALQGKTVDDAYTADTVCDCAIMLPGSESQVLVKAGESIVIGDQLVSAGDGKFKEDTGTDKVLCIALEAADLNDSGDVDTLVKVRWL